MTSTCPYPLAQVAQYITELQARRDDPLECIKFGFEWGKKTLAEFTGPKVWQTEVCNYVRDHFAAGRRLLVQKAALVQEATELETLGLAPQAAEIRAKVRWMVPEPCRITIRSGHGPGKSAWLSWLAWWFKSTRLGSTVKVTANKEAQLRQITMAEMTKWFKLCTNEYWWDCEVMSIRPREWLSTWMTKDLRIPSGPSSYDYLAAVPWSKNNPDALAGTHNQAGMMAIVDEGSNVADAVYDTLQNSYTDPIIDRILIEASNPRRVTGRWAERHQKPEKYPKWHKVHLDVRQVEGVDPNVYEDVIREFGPNSYQAHVQVYGTFPPAGVRQFIPLELVELAQDHDLVPDKAAPLHLGCDPAREGDDDTVFYFRRGRDARSIEPIVLSGMRSDVVVDLFAELIDEYNPATAAIDVGGLGGPIFDELRRRDYDVIPVNFRERAQKDQLYADRRTELWVLLKNFLKDGGCIGDWERLRDDLIGPEMGEEGGKSSRMKLESKDDMKARGLRSPDWADGLCLTFAGRAARGDNASSRSRKKKRRPAVAHGVDYSIYGR